MLGDESERNAMTGIRHNGDGTATFNVTTRAELMAALVVIHSQVEENIGDDGGALNAIEQGMGLLSEAMVRDGDYGEDDDE